MKKPRDFANKPYTKCLTCPHRGVSCRGRTSDLSREHWCEFMSALKEITRKSDAALSLESGLSISTVNRIVTLDAKQDIMRDNVIQLENALLGTARDYPCLLDMDKVDVANEAQAFRDTIEGINAEHRAEIAAVRADMQATIDTLREQVAYLRTENERKARIIEKIME